MAFVAGEFRDAFEAHFHQLVALENAGDHLVWGSVSGQDPDVEHGVVESDPHLGDLRRRHAFQRLLLLEPGGDGCVAPGGLVQEAVDAEPRRLAAGKTISVDVWSRRHLCDSGHHG